MITRRISLTLAALVGVGLALGTSAGAQVIVQTFTIPSQAVPFTDSFTFNTFNTSMGLLGGVTLSLSTSVTAEVDIFNSLATNQAFTNANASIPVTLTGPGPVNITATSTAGPVNGTAIPGFNAFPGLPASASTTLNVLPAFWSFYENPPSGVTGLLTAAATSGTYSGNANPGVFFGGSAVASGTITLTYFYQAAGTIPEPGTTTFLAAGVLGSLGMVLRRRKKQRLV
jgi:uncharacterized protein (TIGR03382 family)